MPLVLGHEFSGVVAEVGSGVEGYAEGDAVTIEPLYRCGSCRACSRGTYNLCEKVGFAGPPPSEGAGGGLSGCPARGVSVPARAHGMV